MICDGDFPLNQDFSLQKFGLFNLPSLTPPIQARLGKIKVPTGGEVGDADPRSKYGRIGLTVPDFASSMDIEGGYVFHLEW